MWAWQELPPCVQGPSPGCGAWIFSHQPRILGSFRAGKDACDGLPLLLPQSTSPVSDFPVSPLPSPSLSGPHLSALPGLLSQLDPGLGVISVHRLILRGTDPRHWQNRAASLPSKRSSPAPADALCWPLSLSAPFCPGWRRGPQSPAQPGGETQAEAGRAPAPARWLQHLVIKNRPFWLEGMVFKDGRTP